MKGCKQHAGARRWLLEGADSLRIAGRGGFSEDRLDETKMAEVL